MENFRESVANLCREHCVCANLLRTMQYQRQESFTSPVSYTLQCAPWPLAPLRSHVPRPISHHRTHQDMVRSPSVDAQPQFYVACTTCSAHACVARNVHPVPNPVHEGDTTTRERARWRQLFAAVGSLHLGSLHHSIPQRSPRSLQAEAADAEAADDEGCAVKYECQLHAVRA